MSDAQSGWKLIAYRILVGVFVVGLITSTAAIWANVRIHESDAWARTVAPLADDPAVQAFVVNQASAIIDQQIAADESAGRLASFSRAQLSGLVEIALNDFVTSPTFSTWWTEANRNAHGIVMRTMDDEQGVVLQTQGGDLVLDLRPAVDWVNGHLEALFPRASYLISLPAEQAVIVLYSSHALETTARVIDLVDTLALVLPILTVLSLAGVFILKRDVREAISQLAIWVAAGTVLALVVLNVARWWVVSQQAGTHQEVLDAIVRIVLADLVGGFRVIAIVSVLWSAVSILLRAEFMSNPRVRAFIRENRELGAIAGIGLALGFIVFSNYPPIWLSVLAAAGAICSAVLLFRWRNETLASGAPESQAAEG